MGPKHCALKHIASGHVDQPFCTSNGPVCMLPVGRGCGHRICLSLSARQACTPALNGLVGITGELGQGIRAVKHGTLTARSQKHPKHGGPTRLAAWVRRTVPCARHSHCSSPSIYTHAHTYGCFASAAGCASHSQVCRIDGARAAVGTTLLHPMGFYPLKPLCTRLGFTPHELAARMHRGFGAGDFVLRVESWMLARSCPRPTGLGPLLLTHVPTEQPPGPTHESGGGQSFNI